MTVKTIMSLTILNRAAATLALGASLAVAAHAESNNANITASSKYQQECAACHIAYPPGMLPAAS